VSQATLAACATGKRSRGWALSRIAWPGLLFVLCYVMMLLNDFGTSRYLLDKSWFLHVVNRMTSGDVLYRDMFFPATPLSIYLTALFTAPFGNEFLIAEAVWAVWLVLLILASLSIARQLGLGGNGQSLLALALIVFMVPWMQSPYTLLAMLWLAACGSATLAWVSRNPASAGQGDRWLVAAGTAAGLCFVSKHNLGAFAVAALAMATATYGGGWANRRQWPRIVALTAGPFLIVTLAVMLPVLTTGGLDKFLEYGFGSKETYLSAARIDYGEGLALLASQVSKVRSGVPPQGLYWQLLYLLPPLTVVALVAAWLRVARGERDRVTTVLAFVVAASLVVIPRATLSYVIFTLPIVLPGLGYAVRLLAPGLLDHWEAPVHAAAALWIAVGAALIVGDPITVIARGDYEVSELPHFHGLLIADDAKSYFHTAEKLAALDGEGDAPFVLSNRAGFLYLASGVANPTPYDYPLVTAFGRTGLAETLAALQDGDLRSVCLDHDFSSTNDPRRLQPKDLIHFVEQEMEPRRDLGACVLYRRQR
jgi:hypothetical protein